MIKKLIGFITLKFLRKKLDGHVTQIGGVIPFLMAVAGSVALLFPEQGVQYQLPEMTWEQIGLLYSGAFAAWGLGGKGQKIINEIREAKAVGHTNGDIKSG